MNEEERRENLQAAYKRVKQNKGKPGVDHISIECFGRKLDEYLSNLQEGLKRDRIVQGAVKNVTGPIFERIFTDTSYGFRPKRHAKQALAKVEEQLNQGLCWLLDCDIKSYFDTIPHDKLIGRVKEHITDSRVLTQLQLMLEQGIMETHKEWVPTQGTPQGGVISPLLANIYLNELDHQLIQRGVKPTRYADDVVVQCESREQAEATLGFIQQWMEGQGLTLHPDKTKVIDMSLPQAELDFLGYTFKRTDKGTLNKSPRRKSMNRFRETIRQHTKRTNGICLPETIRRVNRVSRGGTTISRKV